MSAADPYLRNNSIIERVQINNEKFIQEVYKRRSLWDQKSVDYLNRSLKAKEWESVAQEMNCAVEEVKNRWKLLKDSFNREVRNMTKNCSTSSKWAHFEQMSFLLKGSSSNFLLPSAYLSQSMIELDSSSHNASSNYDNELSENSLTMPEEESEVVYQLPQKKKAKLYHARPSPSSTYSPTTLQADPIRPEHANEDYYFLMSLLPTFERMPPKQKMLVKIKMMQDVYEAAFSEKRSASACNLSSEAQHSCDPVSSGS